MIGFFKIKSFGSDKDSAQSPISVAVESTMDSGIEGTLFLPPYLRQNECAISLGSTVFGIMDDTSGLGVALYGKDCDFGYFFDADILIKKNLTVTKDITSSTGNITASTGDVVATSISLKNHIHQIVTMPPQDCASIVAAATSGLPAPLSATYTIIPK